jgi:hypothetical protein
MFIFFVWCLWAVAAIAQVEIENTRCPLPKGQRRGMSGVSVIPIFSLVFWGMAEIIDLFVDPWGTVVIGSIHIIYAIILVGSIIRDFCRLYSGTVKPVIKDE